MNKLYTNFFSLNVVIFRRQFYNYERDVIVADWKIINNCFITSNNDIFHDVP